MEWIKAKYDRLLLGVFGVIAVIVGGLLLMKVLGFKGNFPNRPVAEEKSDFGTTKAGEQIKDALEALKKETVVKAPVKDGVDISLFSSVPIIRMAGEKENREVLSPDSAPIRPPVSNRWLYDNGLDIRRVDILEIDTDGDKFTNLEEFNADPKTNPRDATSHPPVSAKIYYVECLKDPLTFRFNTYVDDADLTFRRTEPADKAYNTRNLKVGGSFAEERDGTEMRFRLDKTEGPENAKIATVTDLKTKEVIKVKLGETFERPILSAKVTCNHGTPEEKIVKKGETLTFEAEPDVTYEVKELTTEELTLEYTPKGAAEKKTLTLKILPPP
jgi:hypothetical protein